jgi:tetratricopeptide (TPR) repeat protein
MTNVDQEQQFRRVIDRFARLDLAQMSQEYLKLVRDYSDAQKGSWEAIVLAEVLRIYHVKLNQGLAQTKDEQIRNELWAQVEILVNDAKNLLGQLRPRMLNNGGIDWAAEFAQDIARTHQLMGKHQTAINVIERALTGQADQTKLIMTEFNAAKLIDKNLTFQQFLLQQLTHNDAAAQEVGWYSASAVLEMRLAESLIRHPELAKNGDTAVGLMTQALIDMIQAHELQPNSDRLKSLSKHAVEKGVKGILRQPFPAVRLILLGRAQISKIERPEKTQI